MVYTVSCQPNAIVLDSPKIMGVINVTPDSFSDGGQFYKADDAIRHAHTLIQEGADIIDIGGESTRPFAEHVDASTELDRVIPVIKGLSKTSPVPISIDTSKPLVMAKAIEAGASIINDVNALQTPGAIEVAAEYQVPVCLMHKQGTPQTMQNQPQYGDVVDEIYQFLSARIEACLKAGIQQSNIIIDPGFGFGKTLSHNLTILHALPTFLKLNTALLVGLSRKSMFGQMLDEPENNRLYGSIAGVTIAATNGAHIFRVHDVKATRDALKVCHAYCQNAHESVTHSSHDNSTPTITEPVN